ncbi:MAG: fused MFS/spermidine synthase [Anaerolineales bacterium]|nr:fused MFS/spermidine synthase [Anaerolineales bacterium]
MRKYIYFTVFISGMTTLAAEFGAARLLGNVFGTSNLVWASIIGLIMIYLTAGYFLGGRWADRSPHPKTLYKVLAWGAFTVGVVPFVAQPVLRAAAIAFDGLQFGIMLGSFAGVLVLFSIPVTLLGAISPFAIRISVQDTETTGNVAGTLYAISTLGSVLGSFLPTLVLIPTIGTLRTFLAFSLTLLAVALIGLWLCGQRRDALIYLVMPIILILAAVITSGQSMKQSKGQVYETESAYNYIQVLEQNGYTLLRLNDGQGVHSVYHPEILSYNGPWEQFLVGPFFNEGFTPEQVKRVGIVGLAAGTTARQATAAFGAVPIDGWEIDPKIVEVGRDYFGMDMPNLNVHIQDGRWGLMQSPYQYTIIGVDAYRPPYIPPHMTTREFFQVTYDHLEDDGVLTINVGRSPGDRRLINGLATTIASIYPSVYVIDIPYTFNSIVYATKQPTHPDNLVENLTRLQQQDGTEPLLLVAIQTAVTNLQPGYETAQVFTDDKAPIEWITNNMIINFVLHGETEILQ